MIPKLAIQITSSSLSCYTHDKNGITFKPTDFFGDVSTLKRDLSIDYAIWDHGDGTLSKSLTSIHQYKNPGTYKASLIVYDNEGQQYRSNDQITINVHNYISDTLSWVNHGSVFNIPASTKKWYPFKVELFKSWQTWPSVSATGYSLTLNASGSNSEKLNIRSYYNDKWSHLRNIWTFHRPITSGNEEILLPIERYDLKDVTTLLYLSGTKLTSVSSKDTIFVGTSATAEFYYYDETPKNFTSKDDPLICFASLDTKDFIPEYSTGDGAPPVTLDLASTKPVIMPCRIRSSYSSKISINNTGITSFTLPNSIYTGSKVPFFACYTDSDNNAKENNYPPLSATQDTLYNRTSDFYKVKLQLLDSAGKKLSADWHDGGWDTELPKEIPNYYRGYFIPREPADGARIHAESYIIDNLTASREYYYGYFVSPSLSSVFIISRPDKRIKYDWPLSVGKVKVDIADSKTTDIDNHEVYPVCVVPDQSTIGTTFDRSFVYVGDGKSRKIHKLDWQGKRLNTFDAVNNAVAKHFPPRLNDKGAEFTDVDPVVSRIASDRDGDLWVSLYDSISSFKLDQNTGAIKHTIADIDFTKYYQSGSNYLSYSDVDTSQYHISDIGKAVAIETDVNGGPWVAYDRLSGSHVTNYDSAGKLKRKVELKKGQYVYDMMVNNRNVLWLSTYYDRYDRPTVKNLTSYIDDFIIYKADDLDYGTLKFKFICKDDNRLNDILAREELDVIDVLDTPDHRLNMQYVARERGEQYEMSEDPDRLINADLSAYYSKYTEDPTVKENSGFDAAVRAYNLNPDFLFTNLDAFGANDWAAFSKSTAQYGYVGNWYASRGIATPYKNEHGAPAGVFPCLKFAPGETNESHYIRLSDATEVGKQYRLKTKIYIPHPSTGNKVTRVIIQDGGAMNHPIWDSAGSTGHSENVPGFPQKYDEWIDVDVTYTATGTAPHIFPLGPGWTFKGGNNSRFYITEVDLTTSAQPGGNVLDGTGPSWIGRGTVIETEHHSAAFMGEPARSLLKVTATGKFNTHAGGFAEYHRVTCDLNGDGETRIVSGKKYNITGRIYIPSGADTLRRFQFRHGNGISHAFLPGEDRATYGSHIIKPNTNSWHDFEFEWTASDQNGAYEGWIEFWMGKDSATDTTDTFLWKGNKNKGSNPLNAEGMGRDYFYLDNIKVKQIAAPNTTANQKRNVISYKVRCHQSMYFHHLNDLRSYPLSGNPDVFVRVREGDEIYRISANSTQTRSGFLYPTYLTIDLKNNVWVTHSNNILTNIVDDPAGIDKAFVFHNYVGETATATPSTFNTNLQFQNHDALTCTLNNDIYVLDNFHKRVYVIDADTRSEKSKARILSPADDEAYTAQLKASPEYVDGEESNHYYQAIGDWNGIRYFHKFENQAIDVKRITGESTFDILPASGKYHAYKVHEDFDPQDTLESYRTQPNLYDSELLFTNFFGQSLGTAKSAPTCLGKRMYESIANFTPNHGDSNTCIIPSIKSQAKMTGVKIDPQYNYTFPGSLNRVMNLVSVQKDTLWGKRDNYVRNFTSTASLPSNIGSAIDVKTYMVTPGTPIVAHELYSNSHVLIVPKFLQEDFTIDLKNNKLEEYQYPLSSYGTLDGKAYNWNWAIMDSVTGTNIGDYYHFYTFVDTPANIQATGVIDWSNNHNTLKETNSGYTDWVKQNGVMDKMIEFELRKNLDLFSTADYKQLLSATSKFAVTDVAVKSTTTSSNIETVEFLQNSQTSYIPASGVATVATTTGGTTISEELQGEGSAAADTGTDTSTGSTASSDTSSSSNGSSSNGSSGSSGGYSY